MVYISNCYKNKKSFTHFFYF